MTYQDVKLNIISASNLIAEQRTVISSYWSNPDVTLQLIEDLINDAGIAFRRFGYKDGADPCPYCESTGTENGGSDHLELCPLVVANALTEQYHEWRRLVSP